MYQPLSNGQDSPRGCLDGSVEDASGKFARELDISNTSFTFSKEDVMPTAKERGTAPCHDPYAKVVSHRSVQQRGVNGTVMHPLGGRSTLEAVLECIPLVYDPVTKKLHIRKEKPRLEAAVTDSLPVSLDNGKAFSMDDGLILSDEEQETRQLCEHTRSLGADLSDSASEGVDLDVEDCLDADGNHVLGNNQGSPTPSLGLFSEQKAPVNGAESESCQDFDGALQNCSAAVSFPQTDASSFTSISSISTGTEFSVLACDTLDGSDTGIYNSTDDLAEGTKHESSKGAKPKKRSLSSLFPSLLSWRSKDSDESSLKESVSLSSRAPSPSPSIGRKTAADCVASSTTALIFENRPANLPAKPPEEEQKHKQEYEEMVRAARKKEIRDAKLKKKQMQQQVKQEEQLISATKLWSTEILPNWDTAREARKTQDLWWQGIPPSVRGKVWKLAIGNELNITSELYDICVNRAKEKIWASTENSSSEDKNDNTVTQENSAELITLDVSRTFPQLGIFQEGGPYHDTLHSILGAYVIYRPDVGYVQGMSFLAAVLLLNMESVDAFVCFANILNKPCQIAFFRLDEQLMKTYYSVYEEFFKENLPKLFSHFKKHNLSSDLYLVDWIYTLFSRSLPLDMTCRVWDLFLRDGEEFLFRTALGILKMYEDILLQLDFIHLAQFLTRLPEDINADTLFGSIVSIRMFVSKKHFQQILSKYKECNYM